MFLILLFSQSVIVYSPNHRLTEDYFKDAFEFQRLLNLNNFSN